jgi:hypothetical protein
MAPNHVQLTVKGWDYLDPGSGGAGIAGRVFVAMSFHKTTRQEILARVRRRVSQPCRLLWDGLRFASELPSDGLALLYQILVDLRCVVSKLFGMRIPASVNFLENLVLP